MDSGFSATNTEVASLNEELSNNTLYWIISVLIVAILVLMVFVISRKQLVKQSSDLTDSIHDTRKSLEEEHIKLDDKLIEILESQLKSINSKGKSNEDSHVLALKVADEIVRIQKNTSRMDESTKGLKQLIASVKRIEDNFLANGYEIVAMLGEPFIEGINASVTFIADDELGDGERIITKVIKPQINFNGEMIQSAQIEVSQGE